MHSYENEIISVLPVRDNDGFYRHINDNGDFAHDMQFQQLGVYHKGFAVAKDEEGWFHIDINGNQIINEGLKTIKKRLINNQCADILAPSDWMYIKAGEEGVSMDSGWKTWRASVRTKCNSMQTQIDNAADVDALEALYTYTTTDGVKSRPLGEFPIKE